MGRSFAMNNKSLNIYGSTVCSLLNRSDEPIFLSKNSYSGAASEEDTNTLASVAREIVKHKKETLDKVSKALNTMKKYEVQCEFRDIIGVPGSEKDEARDVMFGKVLYTKDVQAAGEWNNKKKTLKDAFYKETCFRMNYPATQLMSIKRNRKRWQKSSPCPTTFDQPLAMYMRNLKMLAADKNESIIKILTLISDGVTDLKKRMSGTVMMHCCDDVIRSFLSEVDNITFVNSYKSKHLSQTLTCLHGLSTMGGPRGWVEEEVHEQIKDWVSGEREVGTTEAREFKHSWMKEKITEWVRNKDSQHLSFSEYQTDPMRWATSGGAPSVYVNGEKIRSKWAWALDALTKKEPIYEQSLKTHQVAKVALKEEKKVRTVITTPLPSYLRQCYMLYRLGNMNIKSTISDPGLASLMAKSGATWFMSIDAKNFDHSIPKSEIITFFELILENLSEDDDLYDLVKEEIECIKNLKIEFLGTEYRYENGLLSGWRITSLIGSLHSAMVCEWIKKNVGRAPFSYITQGDDIILYGYRSLDQEIVLNLCLDFGIQTNFSKTTSGTFGEFLKYRYSKNEITGYPARAVRSIFYSNPWLDDTIETKPQEVASKWYTMLGRMMISTNLFPTLKHRKNFVGSMANDINSWSGRNSKIQDVYAALKTPISVGGLGMMENMEMDDGYKHASYTRMQTTYLDEKTKFYSLFMNMKGVVKVERRTLVHKQRLDIAKAANIVTRSRIIDLDAGRPRYDNNVNILRSILESVCMGRKISRMDAIRRNLFGKWDDCTRFYPRYLKKTSNWYERLKCLMSEEGVGAPHSFLAGLRYNITTAKTLSLTTSRYINNLRSVTPNNIWVAAGYAISMFRDSYTTFNSL